MLQSSDHLSIATWLFEEDDGLELVPCLKESLSTFKAALISFEGSTLVLLESSWVGEMGVNRAAPGRGKPLLELNR